RIFDWLAAVEAATGRKAIVYSYPSWFSAVQLTDAQLAQYPLFIATYGNCASVPAPWTSAIFWQYSATASVPGITGNVDVDRFFGSDVAGWNMPPAGADAGVGPDAGAPQASAGCGCQGSDPSLVIAFAAAGLRRARARRRPKR